MPAHNVIVIVSAISLLLSSLVASEKTAAADRQSPVSVASINLCADQLIMLLADSEQIKSLSNLSQQSAGSYFYQRASDFSTNEGHAEQILPLQPDLVIAGTYSNIHTVNLLQEVGLQVEVLPIATDIDTLFENIRLVANWLDRTERGEGVIQSMQRRLAALTPGSGVRPVAAVYDPNGFTVGIKSLRGQMMELAGWENAATQAGIEAYGQLSLEALIQLSPVALIESPYSPGTWSRGQAVKNHPALKQAGLAPLLINIPSRMTICAGPWTVDVIEQLQAERLQFAASRQ